MNLYGCILTKVKHKILSLTTKINGKSWEVWFWWPLVYFGATMLSPSYFNSTPLHVSEIWGFGKVRFIKLVVNTVCQHLLDEQRVWLIPHAPAGHVHISMTCIHNIFRVDIGRLKVVQCLTKHFWIDHSVLLMQHCQVWGTSSCWSVETAIHTPVPHWSHGWPFPLMFSCPPLIALVLPMEFSWIEPQAKAVRLAMMIFTLLS